MREAPTSLDAWLGGRLQLCQPAKGHRAGTDAALLVAASPDARRVVDVGAGVGAAGLAMLALGRAQTMQLVEIDPWLADLASGNARRNGLAADIRRADTLKPASRRAAGLVDAAADLVVTNPPFLAAGAVRASPDAGRARAHVMADGGLGAWIKACAALLAPGGRLVMIHRAEALAEILAICDGRLGGLAIRPVQPQPSAPANRLLVAGVKGSRAPLTLLPALVLHEATGAFTAQAEALHRGEARL